MKYIIKDTSFWFPVYIIVDQRRTEINMSYSATIFPYCTKSMDNENPNYISYNLFGT